MPYIQSQMVQMAHPCYVTNAATAGSAGNASVTARAFCMAPKCLQSPTHRQQIEEALLAELRRREKEWLRASEENRDRARQRFLDALLLLLHMLAQGSTPADWPWN
jgi:hypothetical protein